MQHTPGLFLGVETMPPHARGMERRAKPLPSLLEYLDERHAQLILLCCMASSREFRPLISAEGWR